MILAKMRMILAKMRMILAKMRMILAKMRMILAKMRMILAKMRMILAGMKTMVATANFSGAIHRVSGAPTRIRIASARSVNGADGGPRGGQVAVPSPSSRSRFRLSKGTVAGTDERAPVGQCSLRRSEQALSRGRSPRRRGRGAAATRDRKELSKMSVHKKSDSHSGAPTMDVTAVLGHLDNAIAALALPSRTLTTKQRKAATRSRKGMEKVISTLATLSAEHGVSVPKQPTSEMTSNLELVTQLDPVKQKLVSLLTLVQDNMDTAGSSSFNTATTLYGMLQKAAHRDAQLKSQLAPVKEFFSYRTPAAKKAHPKQKGKKAALAAEKEAAAKAKADRSVAVTGAPLTPEAPSAASVIASTPASPVPAVSNVVPPHAP
jgi:hypothetical protein